jgi:hypothetical protein
MGCRGNHLIMFTLSAFDTLDLGGSRRAIKHSSVKDEIGIEKGGYNANMSRESRRERCGCAQHRPILLRS